MAAESTCLPTFLIIGAQKAGTTALYYALSKHPEIFMSTAKEPGYFVPSASALQLAAGPGDEASQMVTSLDAYEALFAEARSETARGEASTSYLYDPEAAERIRRRIPDVKLIAILRNPVDRAYSNFLHLVRDGREPLHDFRAALAHEDQRRTSGWSTNWRYKDKGFYGRQIEKYLVQFDRIQIRFYLYEDYDDDPHAIVRDIYRFLGVDDTFSQDLSVRLNVGGMPKSKSLQWFSRHSMGLKWLIDPMVPDRLRRGLLKAQNTNLSRPPLSLDVREELMEAYRADIACVGELTGLNVSRWMESDPETQSRSR